MNDVNEWWSDWILKSFKGMLLNAEHLEVDIIMQLRIDQSSQHKI